jgi:spore coat polysaccharide biosynthesis protein SpsF
LLTIIQARTNSKRFKNKILYPINGKPLIWHVINSIKNSKKVTKIIVSTSNIKNDDKLIKYLRKIKISYFRGDLNNVAKRLLETAISYKKNFFIRINGDSPLIDSKIIDKVISIYKKKKFNNYDLITNVFPRTFPKGQSVEIIKTLTLKNHIHKMDKDESEHVTKYFYKNHSKFKIKNLKSNDIQRQKKLSVDTKKDMVRIKKILELKKL